MAIGNIITSYVVPVIGGVFILFFIAIFFYIIHRTVLKPLGVYRVLKEMRLGMRRKKILGDEKVIEYCVARVERDFTEAQVREELLLANKYKKDKIDEMIFAFNSIKREMKGDGKTKPAVDLP